MMTVRSRLLLAAVAFLVLPFSPALTQTVADIPSKQNSAAEKQAVERMAKYYEPIAVSFKCPQFAWGSFLKDQVNMQIEYVPQGDKVASWTRLMTMTLFPLPKDTPGQIDAMRKIEGALLNNFKGSAKILDQQVYQTDQGLPRLYVEYEIGEGPQKEHAASAFLMLAPGIASFIQIQGRGKPFNPDDAANMKLLVQGKLKIDRPS
jgi:hypothetical protein